MNKAIRLPTFYSYGDIPFFNDASTTTWCDINALLTRAIKSLEPYSGLEGPSKTVIVEPIETPQRTDVPEEPTPTPVETPEQEPVPA